ncbi:MAG: ABC transporter permease [Anaerolineaceae bacterium]|nr:ABC transporter permease [Anaerolineaceae bacterium]
MDWSLILNPSFFISTLTTGVTLSIPVLLAVLGEIITESSGTLNLGLEGIMAMGAATGFMTAFFFQSQSGPLTGIHSWLGLLVGIFVGMLMGLLMGFLTITLKADQVISGITLVVFGLGLANYLYRQAFATLSEPLKGFSQINLPILSRIPFLGDLLFKYDVTVYLALILVLVVWYFLFRTTWGQNIRAVGENPAAAETSGINVNLTRYAALLIGTGLVGLAGAVLSVAQLGLFVENVTAGKGWIAVALVIFARWRSPKLALVGALLFGLANSIQYRIQALSQVAKGATTIPYEFLLMLPYILTIAVLLYRSNLIDQPAALGRPYERSVH